MTNSEGDRIDQPVPALSQFAEIPETQIERIGLQIEQTQHQIDRTNQALQTLTARCQELLEVQSIERQSFNASLQTFNASLERIEVFLDLLMAREDRSSDEEIQIHEPS